MITEATIYKVTGIQFNGQKEPLEIEPQYVYIHKNQISDLQLNMYDMALTKAIVPELTVIAPKNTSDTIKIQSNDELLFSLTIAKTTAEVIDDSDKAGYSAELLERLYKKILPLIKSSKNEDYKIGVTANPAQRFTYYLNSKSDSNKTWKKMIVLYKARTANIGYQVESALIEKREKGKQGNLNNRGTKETGLKTEGACFVYIVFD